MTLDTALKLVYSGGRIELAYNGLQIQERLGVLYASINGIEVTVEEAVLRSIYGQSLWVAH